MISDIDSDITNLEAKLSEKKKQRDEFNSLPEDLRLAEFLHEKFCHSNHTDQCGWLYESWDKLGYSRKEYLEKAKNLLKDSTYDSIVKIVKLL